MTEAIADVLHAQASGGFTGTGGVAAKLLASGFNPQALRANGVLRQREWIQYDTAIVNIARNRLIGVADLLNAGLRYDVPNGLGTTRVEWEKISDMSGAEISMSGVTPSERDRVLFDLDYLPLPIVHKDFSLNIRVLEASRTTGQPLDTTQAEVAARKVADKLEDLLFLGGYTAGAQGTIYGYTTAPNRNTGSVTASWLTATGDQIVGDVLAMINAAVADNYYGPYMIYVPTAVFTHMGDDYKTYSDKTIVQRVKEIPGVLDVRPSSRLTASNIILVNWSKETVDMVVGMQPTPLQWDEMGGLQMMFKVMSIMVPRIKNDYTLQSGLVHYS